MREFKSIEELQDDEELKKMGRYCWEKVKLNGKEVFACSTNQQYEDIIWSETYEMLEHLFQHFNIEQECNPDYFITDLSSQVRDFVLETLEENGIKFVDVYDEY